MIHLIPIFLFLVILYFIDLTFQRRAKLLIHHITTMIFRLLIFL